MLASQLACQTLAMIMTCLLRQSDQLPRLQGSMVESAKYFYDKLIHNTLGSAINLPKDATHATGLLGHSVGAGLATYMARQADKECGRPFKAVMYLAPATKFLVPKYTPETALQGWRPQDKTTTHLAVQYGGRDTTASKEEADGLVSKLRAACNSCSTNTSKVGSLSCGQSAGIADAAGVSGCGCLAHT